MFTLRLHAQINRDQIIGSYIYNFANKVNRSGKNLQVYTIVLLSSDEGLIQELKKVASQKKVNEKPVELQVSNKPSPSITDAQLVYIARDKLQYYMTVFDMVEGKEILLVSEGFNNKSYVMLNLYDTPDGSIKYEINKPNIINQKLTLTDEVLLMGGTEIDIAEIYLKSQHTLRDMEKKLSASTYTLDSLRQHIADNEELITYQNTLIQSHKDTLMNQNKILELQNKKINTYQVTTNNYSQQLNNLHDSLYKTEKELKIQHGKITKSQKTLSNQKAEIDSINVEIENRNQILLEQEGIIGKQQFRLNILLIILAVIIVLVVLLIFAFRQNIKKSEELQFQRTKIETINEELKTNNEKLVETLEQMKQMQEQLVHSEKMASLGLLSAGIAHEINNPINFVYAGINSLLRDFEDIKPILGEINSITPETDDLKERLDRIQQLKEENYFDDAFEAIPNIIKDIKLGADRTSEIVKGLRTFSRLDKEVLKGVSVHEGLETSLLLLRNRYKNTIEIVKEYDPNLPEIEGYPGKINQVFLNILSNAIDAIEGTGKIYVKTKFSEGLITISIKDTGTGIDPESQKKIFDPFFTTKPVGQGTGLGLSISYSIIEEHHGSIKSNSEPGKGCEFIITLPATKN